MTRRQWITAAAALPAAMHGAKAEQELVRQNDEAVERGFTSQVTDRSDRAFGGTRDAYGLFWPGSGAGLLHVFVPALLHPASRFHGAPEVSERCRYAIESLARGQNEHGNYYLVTTNYNSPPDTAFIMLQAATVASLARKHGREDLLRALQPIIAKAGRALAIGGIHTPNHRWVVSSALAIINSVFPEPAYVRRIDQWLAEGVDIDADGQFTERSTIIYNAITDAALVTLADRLQRPHLLDPVRRNLQSMLYLLHPGEEVVTDFSTRQDLYQRGGMERYWFPLSYLAALDGNGQYAALAARVSSSASLAQWMDYPTLQRPLPAFASLPADYEKQFPQVRLVRIRRGITSASILYDGQAGFFTLRRGHAVIKAVRFASAFYGKGQFQPRMIERHRQAYVLSQRLEAPYWQPLEPARQVPAGAFDQTRSERRRTEISTLHQSAEIVEAHDGFRLRLRSHGTDHVPVAIEINLRTGGELTGCKALASPVEAFLLPAGQASYTLGGNTIRFGPGKASHSYVELRGALPKLAGPSVYVTGETPFDCTLDFQLE